MNIAVLTGDIISSTKLTPHEVDTVMETIAQAADDISGWAGGTVVSGFARRGGDSWQIALNRSNLALRASLYVIARLRAMGPKFATRIAAASGQGDIPTQPGRDLNSAHGPAFTSSGRLLDALSGKMEHSGAGALGAAFCLADHIAQGWTPAQARAVAEMLPTDAGPRRLVAEKLGISRQAVDQALHAAGFPAIQKALDEIESAP